MLAHIVLYSVQKPLRLNKQYAISLFKIQTPGHSNLWVLIQKFQKYTVLFLELYFTKKSLLRFLPHDTTAVNQQKILNGYLQTDNCKIKLQCILFKVLLLLSLSGYIYSRDSNSKNTCVS